LALEVETVRFLWQALLRLARPIKAREDESVVVSGPKHVARIGYDFDDTSLESQNPMAERCEATWIMAVVDTITPLKVADE
jgi:hypothetical protein